MESYLKAGILAIISTSVLKVLTLGVLVPSFLPAFIVAIVLIVIFKIENIKEALVVVLMSYFFSTSLISTFMYVFLYFGGLTLITFQLTMLDIIDSLLTPITAIVAAFIGIYFVKITHPKTLIKS